MKFGFSFPLHALEGSDAAMDRYLKFAEAKTDFLHILAPDEDSMPCVQREWRLEGVDDEILDVCARAWLRLGEVLAVVVQWLGADAPPLSLECRHSSQRVQFKVYDREKLIKRMEEISSAS